jgi:phosphatidylglycerol:prolipoprotein diacylglycerol transferase
LLGFYDYGLPSGPFNPLSRGKSFLGGLFGGVLGAVAYLRIRRVSAARYGDVLVAALALGYAVGRVGCFFNGCDYGVCTPLPWGHSYPPGTEAYAAHLARGWITAESPVSLPVHPVQLYASACGFVIFAILLARKPPWPGANLCLFAISYGAYRYCIEFLRGDFHSFVLGLSLPQAVSILLVAGGVAFSLWKTSRGSARMSALRLVGANSRAGALPRPP